MNYQNLKDEILKALKEASDHDQDKAEKSPQYAAHKEGRRIDRAENALSSLAIGLTSQDPELSAALLEFCKLPPLSAAATAAVAQERHMAGSERIIHPAPGTKR